MISSYQETLHNLLCWLSECQHHGKSRGHNGVLAGLEDWSGTLLDKQKTYQAQALGQKPFY